MFHQWRLKRIHARFLDSCRNLKEGRAYWNRASGFRKWLLETVSPVPLLGLHENSHGLLVALQWLESNCHERVLDDLVIRNYHKMVGAVSTQSPGEFRKGRITVIGSKIPRPEPERVPALMNQFCLRISHEQKRLDEGKPTDETQVLSTAVDIYQRIGLIHPFPDGNGRVARLAMNHFLRRYQFSYVILPPLSEEPEIMDALQEAHCGNPERLLRIARACLSRL